METSAAARVQPSPRETLESVVIRFAGDSGDGMQLTGSQFTTGSVARQFPDNNTPVIQRIVEGFQ